MTREEAIKLRPHYAELFDNIPPMPPKWKPGPGQATEEQIAELIRLVPDREQKIWELVYAGLSEEDARGTLEAMRKPRMPEVAVREAERLHAQSGEVLAQRQADELRRLRENRNAAGRWAGKPPDDGMSKAERELLIRQQQVQDYWQERKLADAEYERRFREDAGIEAYDRNVIWGGRR